MSTFLFHVPGHPFAHHWTGMHGSTQPAVSLSCECSPWTSLFNFRQNSCISTAEGLVLHRVFKRIRLRKWKCISSITANENSWTRWSSPQSFHTKRAGVKFVWWWACPVLSKQRGQVVRLVMWSLHEPTYSTKCHQRASLTTLWMQQAQRLCFSLVIGF